MQKSYQLVLNLFLVIGFSLFAIAWSPAIASAAPIIPHPEELVHAVQEIEALEAMRTDLASSLEGSTEEPTQQTMKTEIFDILSSIEGYPPLEMALDKYLMAIPSGYYTIANVEELKSLMADHQALVVDVREPSEYKVGHIPSAINIPLRTISRNLSKIPSNHPVILYCSTGYRSSMGVMILHLLNYDNVKGFPPSLVGWQKAGEEITKA